MSDQNTNTQGTQSQAQPAASQSATPSPAADKTLETIQQELAQLKKQVADKDKFISDLQSTNQTLEARFNQIVSQPNRLEQRHSQSSENDDVAKILETAQVDPKAAGEELTRVIHKVKDDTLQNIEPIISNMTYVNEVKSKNQDLVELGLEPAISIQTQRLMAQGKSFREAVDIAVAECRQKVDKIKAPVQPSPAPAGATGETGSNRQPEPPPVKPELSDADEIRLLQERRRKMGL